MYRTDGARRAYGRRLAGLAAAVVLCVALVMVGLTLARTVHADLVAQGAASVRETVLEHAVQCYAIEGVYPPDLRYLEDNYGLQIDHGEYIVSYEAIASNVAPSVQVLVRGAS